MSAWKSMVIRVVHETGFVSKVFDCIALYGEE